MRQSMGCANLVALAAAWLCLFTSVVLADSNAPADEITLNRVLIFVNVLDGGPTITLMVEPDETVRDLYYDMHELEGFPNTNMTLKLGETLLDSRRKLSDYNIRDQTILTLEIAHIHSSVKFYVITLDGRELNLTTQLGNSVASLKRHIAQLARIPQVEQRLLLRGKELRDERKLAHYAIKDGITLNIARPLENCRQAATMAIKTLSGATIDVEVDLINTVTDLKQKICEKSGVPVEVQCLSANQRVITGENHLCDLGLEAGSIVNMYLYSSRITSLDQVARLQDPAVAHPVNPYKAPIFHEQEDVSEPVQSNGRRRRLLGSLYMDSRNWITCTPHEHKDWALLEFNPVAYLVPNPDDEAWIERDRRTLKTYSPSETSEFRRLEAVVVRARIKLSSAIRPYRAAANLTSVNHSIKRPAISLGGGFTDMPTSQMVPLGADVNNWAPDAFCDSDLMRVFQLSERVRQMLASQMQTRQGILSIASQRQINRGILFTYLVALAGYPPSIVYNQARADEECAICFDKLTAGSAIRLACEHAFHSGCIFTWVSNQYQEVSGKLKLTFFLIDDPTSI